MTNELEKQFFDTFGIEPKLGCKHLWNGNTIETTLSCFDRCQNYENRDKCEKYVVIYPQITDRILLELICIVLNVFETFEVNRIMDVDSLKEKILKLSMLAKDDVYSQVRTLFEEG